MLDGSICENKLDKSKDEHIWNIKILKASGSRIKLTIITIIIPTIIFICLIKS